MDKTKGIKKQLESDIQRIIRELSKTIAELRKDEDHDFDPVIMKLEYVIRMWKAEATSNDYLDAALKL